MGKITLKKISNAYNSIRIMSSLINRFSAISNSQYLHSKCVGAGNSDMTKHEWILQIRRDSFASYIGHHFLVSYFALSLNQSIGRIKFKLLQGMLAPCGLSTV